MGTKNYNIINDIIHNINLIIPMRFGTFYDLKLLQKIKDDSILMNPIFYRSKSLETANPPLFITSTDVYCDRKHDRHRSMTFIINIEEVIKNDITMNKLLSRVKNDFEIWSNSFEHYNPLYPMLETSLSEFIFDLARYYLRKRDIKYRDIVLKEMSNRMVYSTVDFWNAINQISNNYDNERVSNLTELLNTFIMNHISKYESVRKIPKHSVNLDGKSKIRFISKHHYFGDTITYIMEFRTKCLEKAKDIDVIASICKIRGRIECSIDYYNNHPRMEDDKDIESISKIINMFYDDKGIEKIKYNIEKLMLI